MQGLPEDLGEYLNATWRCGGLSGEALERARAEIAELEANCDGVETLPRNCISSLIRKQINIVIRHILEGIKKAHEAVELPADERAEFGIQLSLEEAIVNAEMHGADRDPEQVVTVTLVAHVNENHELVADIIIKDPGGGFNPEDLPDPTDDDHLEVPTGRGLLLIKRFMDTVVVKKPIDGNTVELRKTLGSLDVAEEVEEPSLA